MAFNRVPKTKTQLIDRLTSIDFDGLQNLASDVIVRRPKSNAVTLFFPETGETFELAIHKRREVTQRKDRTAERVGSRRGASVAAETESANAAHGTGENSGQGAEAQTAQAGGRKGSQKGSGSGRKTRGRQRTAEPAA